MLTLRLQHRFSFSPGFLRIQTTCRMGRHRENTGRFQRSVIDRCPQSCLPALGVPDRPSRFSGRCCATHPCQPCSDASVYHLGQFTLRLVLNFSGHVYRLSLCSTWCSDQRGCRLCATFTPSHQRFDSTCCTDSYCYFFSRVFALRGLCAEHSVYCIPLRMKYAKDGARHSERVI